MNGNPTGDEAVTAGDPEGAANARVPLDYRSMPEAMARGELLVTEVSSAGVVGEIRVSNRGTAPVLVLEGEEWSGARQNRALVESTWVRPGGLGLVPVVCSEPGRWSYPGKGAGPAMGESGACLPLALRGAMRRARAARVGCGGGRDDERGQHQGWRAAQDVVRRGLLEWGSRWGMGGTIAEWQDLELRRWEGLYEAFPCVPGQVGWITQVHGAWQSVEVVSRPGAWRRWHGKFLRAVLAAAQPRVGHGGAGGVPATDSGWREAARGILDGLGHGDGSRCHEVEGGAVHEWPVPGWTGAALVIHGELLHAGWQRVEEADWAERGRPPGRGQGMGMTSVPR